jgi:hypothetical protein
MGPASQMPCPPLADVVVLLLDTVYDFYHRECPNIPYQRARIIHIPINTSVNLYYKETKN